MMNRKLKNIREFNHRRILYMMTKLGSPLSIGIYAVDDDLIEILQYQVRDGRIVADDYQPRLELQAILKAFEREKYKVYKRITMRRLKKV